jgi:hypothetical protein
MQYICIMSTKLLGYPGCNLSGGMLQPPELERSDVCIRQAAGWREDYSVTGRLSIAFSLASLSMPSSLLTVGAASAWPPA